MSSFLKGIFGGKDEDGLAVDFDLDPSDQNAQMAEGTRDESVAVAMSAEVMASAAVTPVQESSPQGRAFDIDAVWNTRNVTAQEQERVVKAQQLLSGLPDEIPGAAKRQIVEASLKAFGVSIDDIVSGAAHEIEALKVFIGTTNSDAEDFAAGSKKRIVELEAEIQGIRQTMEAASIEKDRLVGAANNVIEEVTPILDFFEPSQTQARPPMMAAKVRVETEPGGQQEPTPTPGASKSTRAPSIPPVSGA